MNGWTRQGCAIQLAPPCEPLPLRLTGLQMFSLSLPGGWQGVQLMHEAAEMDDEGTTTLPRGAATPSSSSSSSSAEGLGSPMVPTGGVPPAVFSQPSQDSRDQRAPFVAACGGDEAAGDAMLQEHLRWRAATLPLPASHPELPEWAFFHGTTTDGTRILFVNGARIDPSKGGPSHYALSAAAAIDTESQQAAATEQITVLVDTRANDGWANPKIWGIVPVVRECIRVLGANYPERVQRIVIYPLPPAAAMVWQAFKLVLGSYGSKVVLLGGPASRDSPAPEGLADYVIYEQLREDIRPRHASLRRGQGDEPTEPRGKSR